MECSICFELISNPDKEIKNGPIYLCAHEKLFHKECISEWMKNKMICPICRKNIIEAPKRKKVDWVFIYQDPNGGIKGPLYQEYG